MIKRAPAPRPINELRDIFRAQKCDPTVMDHVTVKEVEEYTPAETFEEWLYVNDQNIFEEVLR